MVTDTHRIFAMYRKQFSQLSNLHGVKEVKQTEIHIEEPPVPDPSIFEVEMANEKLKTHKSPGTDQIPAEMIAAGVEQFDVRSINLYILFGIRRNFLRSGRRQSLYLFMRRVIKQIIVIIEASLFSTAYKFWSNILLSRLTPKAEEINGGH